MAGDLNKTPDARGTSSTSAREIGDEHVGMPTFAHPSEAEFARILDFYGLRWDYEPRSFPLRREGDRVVEMLTPDFFLPDLDLYVELTTMKQSLVTEKNRKIRHMRELYPDTNVKLLYRRDFHRLLAKYGFGPLAQAEVKGIDRVLLTAGQIRQRVGALGREISRDYEGGPAGVGGRPTRHALLYGRHDARDYPTCRDRVHGYYPHTEGKVDRP